MKKAMSNVDVEAIAEELRGIVLNGFVGKAYQQSSDKIWLVIQSPTEGRVNILLQAGKQIHITRQERPISKTPPQFPTMLRNYISGGRIVDIRQYDFDRILEIAVQRSDVTNHLIIELFPRGSIVLVDESHVILSMLLKLIYRGRKIAAGEKYLYPPDQLDPRNVKMETLCRLLASSEQDLVRTLVRNLNMGGIYAEEVCLIADVDKNIPAKQLSNDEIERIHQAMIEVFTTRWLDPHIVLKEGIPIDVLPRTLNGYNELMIKRFATFSDALDAFFVEQADEGAKQDPIERRLEIQRKAIQDFSSNEKELLSKGAMTYQRFEEIERILGDIREAKEKGYTYRQIWEKIESSNLPMARSIRSLDPAGEMKIIIDETELELSARLSVPQNAQRYYNEAKEMSRKAQGARFALENTEKLKADKKTSKKAKPQLIMRRKKKWYEKFRWFFSTDGFLVIGGRDADSNEEIYSKYLEKRDIALHTDAPGSPLTVIKTDGNVIPDTSLQEAAQFAVSYSSVWKAGQFSGDCYQVAGNQVTKTPEHGEFLRKGSFVIRGERKYYRDIGVGIGIGISEGILIGGPISSVKLKADPVVEIEPGKYNADDLAKRIYRLFSEKVDDKKYLKAVASVDQIVSFLPPGGSRLKGES
ncbi:MAG: NFACT family protein, partial [Methanotrichaceae archaeon]|nr:NFACT family protein [Methanotrichaceae archaeon]